MFPMMTPIDAIGLSLRAGMMFSQTQSLWVTQMMEMQGFWAGYPRLTVTGLSGPAAEEEPEVDDEDATVVVLPPLTEIHVEALAAVEEAAPEVAVAEPVPDVAAPEPVTEITASGAEALPDLALPKPALDPVLPVAEAVAVQQDTPPEPAVEAPPVAAAARPEPAPLAAPIPNPKRAKKPASRAE